ncbi:MAG: hypothetical protein HC913_24115 [Microscillaceae bacterium]|nr:hypothetical protein [Microscillaceae bacterium]
MFVLSASEEEILAKVPLNKLKIEFRFSIEEITTAKFVIKNTDISSLTILRPGAKKFISLDSAVIYSRQSTADSLVNYLHTSTNAVFAKYGQLIFEQDNPNGVKALFDSLVTVRSNQIHAFDNQLDKDEISLLDFQNKARVYNFCFFMAEL